MKNIIYILLVSGLFSCDNSTSESVGVSLNDSLLSSISQHDTTDTPCRRFKELNTANEYFESANSRIKDCPSDSLTSLVALKELACAVKIDPGFWQARRNYARQLLYFRQYEKCIDQLNKALELVSPEENPDLNVMRGQALYGSGQYKEAIRDYDAGIRFLGNTGYVYLLKAKAEWKLGLKDKACEDLKNAAKSYAYSEEEKEFIDCK